MEYRFVRSDGLAGFALEGRIDSPGAIQLDAAVKEHIIPSDTYVLFDMEGVSYISSAGIRILSGLEKRLRERGGHLFLSSVQPAVRKVLEITGYNRIFTICSTRDEALQRCRLDGPRPARAEPAAGNTKSGHSTILAESFPDHDAVLKVTGSGERICRGTAGPEDFWPRIYDAAEYSAGTGTPGESSSGGFFDAGPLLTLGGAIFWNSPGSIDPPDFLIPRSDAPRILLHTSFSIATTGQFHEILSLEPVSPEGILVKDLCADILAYGRSARGDRCPPVISMVMYAGISGEPVSEGEGGSATGTGCRTLVSLGLCIDRDSDCSMYDQDALDAILCQNGGPSPGSGLILYSQGLLFDAPPEFGTRDIGRLIAGAIENENCTGLIRLPPDARISRAVIGIQYISSIEHADRMPVRLFGDCPGWNRTYETLARWLHSGCTELELQPLTGGFSGTLVFRVYARDSRGRLMMPLVMKLGRWEAIEPEIRGYTDHVKRYIQNNATQIIETERIGDYGGILYNFVGIRGTESRIFSLEDFYLSRTPAEILPVFDSLFGNVLQGWYGEPRRKDLPLYKEYCRFWKYDAIRAYAASHFGATPEMEEIELPFGLGRSTNPLFFVENVMPERMEQLIQVYESSVHGDLNMKNVLMDETGNLWLIDFAETRYSHILRDIVKLEAVIKGEMIPVNSREDLEALVRLDAWFLASRSLSDIPDVPDPVGNPDLEKAFLVVRKLRTCADRMTPDDDDIRQYYLGLLPYTLNLLSYSSVNGFQKEYGWIASSLICRQLMEEKTTSSRKSG